MHKEWRVAVEVVRVLVEAGADLTPVGTGAPGFCGKTAAALASDRGDEAVMNLLMGSEQLERER